MIFIQSEGLKCNIEMDSIITSLTDTQSKPKSISLRELDFKAFVARSPSETLDFYTNSRLPKEFNPKLTLLANFKNAEKKRRKVTHKYCLKYVIKLHGKKLQAKTHFSLAETEVLIHVYWKLSDASMKLSPEFYFDFLYHTFGMNIQCGVTLRGYERFDTSYITVDEFVTTLSKLLRGSLEEKASFVFQVYDLDGNRKIEKEEILTFLRNCFTTYKEENCQNEQSPNQHTVEFVIAKFSQNTDKIGLESFIKFARENPLLIECCCPLIPAEKYSRIFTKMILHEKASTICYL